MVGRKAWRGEYGIGKQRSVQVRIGRAWREETMGERIGWAGSGLVGNGGFWDGAVKEWGEKRGRAEPGQVWADMQSNARVRIGADKMRHLYAMPPCAI